MQRMSTSHGTHEVGTHTSKRMKKPKMCTENNVNPVVRLGLRDRGD